MRPSIEYVTCERLGENSHSGQWKFPRGYKEHNIVCLYDHVVNPYGPVCDDFIEDMSEKYFDETVDVSFFQEIKNLPLTVNHRPSPLRLDWK